jgi:mitogen-activated protein kinase kinase 1
VLLLLQVYVLKVINMDMGNQQVRRQVTREVRALDGARHPHVVSYHQSFFAEGAVTILMEFMDGGTLWDLLQKVRLIWQGCVLCCAVLCCPVLHYMRLW